MTGRAAQPTISSSELISLRVEVQPASDGQGRGHLRGGHKGVGGRVAVITWCEVAVVWGHNGVLVSLLYILSERLDADWLRALAHINYKYMDLYFFSIFQIELVQL